MLEISVKDDQQSIKLWWTAFEAANFTNFLSFSLLCKPDWPRNKLQVPHTSQKPSAW